MKGDKSYISKFLLPVISWVLLLFFGSCSYIQISKGPISVSDLQNQTIPKQSWRMKNYLGDTKAIGWKGWNGDTLAVLVNAKDETVWIGPPIIPLFPVSSGYGHNGTTESNVGEFSRSDRLWITVMFIIAVGHSISIDPCAAVWSNATDTLNVMGMASRYSPLYMGIDDYIPLSYRCESPKGSMTWTNNGQIPKSIFLMLRFDKGIQLKKTSEWHLKLPCVVNGINQIAEFEFKYERRVRYSPLMSPNG